MPERWIRACRRFVPEPLQHSAFDPVVDDLAHAWASRRTTTRSPIFLAAGAVRFRVSVLSAAFECRRLAVRAGLVQGT